jgi:hypothetical protein
MPDISPRIIVNSSDPEFIVDLRKWGVERAIQIRSDSGDYYGVADVTNEARELISWILGHTP